MFGALLSALQAIPRIASAVEGLAASIDAIDQRNREARAAGRRVEKDDEVDRIIDAIASGGMQDGDLEQRKDVNGA